MSRRLRPLAVLALAATMLALIDAGCLEAPATVGGSGGNKNTATAASTSSPEALTSTGSSNTAAARIAVTPTATMFSTGGNGTAATREQAVRFAECMRANGVKEFPDPDASGSLTVDAVINGSSLDPSSAAWKKAISACKGLEPPGFTGGKRSPEQMKAALEFAQCMRDSGVKDFPDPSDTGPLISVNGARSIPGFQAAVGKCRDYLAGALASPGASGSQ